MVNVNQEIRNQLKKFPKPTKFLLAVSGGPDSQALLYAFPHVAKDYGHSCIAVGVDHGLREEAGSELDLAEKLATYVSIPFFRHKIELSKGPNLQARARAARYSALYDIANREGADLIVTGHNLDDRSETVLLRLLRASGAGSLAVLPPLSGRVLRPLLRVPHDRLVRHCEVNEIPYALDPSNENEKYTRVWLRKTVLPLLRSRYPDVGDKLNMIADDMIRVVEERNDIHKMAADATESV
jgi:tRNA(Ile)-lysidine synthase